MGLETQVGAAKTPDTELIIQELQGLHGRISNAVDRLRQTNDKLYGENPQSISENDKEVPFGAISQIKAQLRHCNDVLSYLDDEISRLDSI